MPTGPPRSISQLDPRLDPARVIHVSIVVENPLHPRPPHGTVGAVGQDGRIFDGNVDLIVEPIGHPAANLLRRGPSGIQHHVERMVNVIRPAFLTQPLLELLVAPGALAHSSISMPSHATSTPRCACSAACAESSSRMGLVLLMWIRTFRGVPGNFSNHSSMPPEPLCGKCPMSRACFFEAPNRIISSSVQNVPSTITTDADRIACQTRSSMAPSPVAYTAVRP